MKIGILQTGYAPRELEAVGDFPQLFERLLSDQGFEFETFTVVDGVFPETETKCDGWLVTGSRHGVYEDHPWIPPLEEFIRRAFAADVPIVGVCFGHQIIAQAMGGHVEKYDGGWAVGAQDYRYCGEDVLGNAWHQDQVVTPPESAQVVASNDFCSSAALLYGRTGFTLQWHPEFEAEFVQGLIETRGRGVVPDARLQAAQSNLDTPVHNSRFAQDIGRFFRERTLS